MFYVHFLIDPNKSFKNIKQMFYLQSENSTTVSFHNCWKKQNTTL